MGWSEQLHPSGKEDARSRRERLRGRVGPEAPSVVAVLRTLDAKRIAPRGTVDLSPAAFTMRAMEPQHPISPLAETFRSLPRMEVGNELAQPDTERDPSLDPWREAMAEMAPLDATG
jgi:hypothetical protein